MKLNSMSETAIHLAQKFVVPQVKAMHKKGKTPWLQLTDRVNLKATHSEVLDGDLDGDHVFFGLEVTLDDGRVWGDIDVWVHEEHGTLECWDFGTDLGSPDFGGQS